MTEQSIALTQWWVIVTFIYSAAWAMLLGKKGFSNGGGAEIEGHGRVRSGSSSPDW